MGRRAKPREIVNARRVVLRDGTTFLVDGGLTAAHVTPE